MSDIELVIRISEEDYERCKKRFQRRIDVMSDAIANGIPLPKGHKRLGDLDKIQSMAKKKAEDCFPEGRYDYGYRKALFDFAKDIEDVPTIIEADTERK